MTLRGTYFYLKYALLEVNYLQWLVGYLVSRRKNS